MRKEKEGKNSRREEMRKERGKKRGRKGETE